MLTLQRPVLSTLLVQATHEIDMGEGRQATIYYETENRAHMRRPDGTLMTGDWSLLDDGYAIEWQNGPSATWTLKGAPGHIGYYDKDGQKRGTVRAITFGPNASFSG